MEIKKDNLLKIIDEYPVLNFHFSKYINWLYSNVHENIKDYALINIFLKIKYEKERLEKLEESLEKARGILRLSKEEFRSKFGFNNDLLIKDPEKIHDILIELIIVNILDKKGFKKIKKLPKSIQINKIKKVNSDFTAVYKDKKYAIKIKTIRIESNIKLKEYDSLGVSINASWWIKMFKNNIITKIKDKEQRVIHQLNNAHKYYNCDYKMLAINTRRLGTSSLSEKYEYESILKSLKVKFPQIDYFFVKDYYDTCIFYPKLD